MLIKHMVHTKLNVQWLEAVYNYIVALCDQGVVESLVTEKLWGSE